MQSTSTPEGVQGLPRGVWCLPLLISTSEWSCASLKLQLPSRFTSFFAPLMSSSAALVQFCGVQLDDGERYTERLHRGHHTALPFFVPHDPLPRAVTCPITFLGFCCVTDLIESETCTKIGGSLGLRDGGPTRSEQDTENLHLADLPNQVASDVIRSTR